MLKSEIENNYYNRTECGNLFVLKSDVSLAGDLSEYRKINDISVDTIKHLKLTRIDSKYYKCNEFYEVLHIKGTFTSGGTT